MAETKIQLGTAEDADALIERNDYVLSEPATFEDHDGHL